MSENDIYEFVIHPYQEYLWDTVGILESPDMNLYRFWFLNYDRDKLEAVLIHAISKDVAERMFYVLMNDQGDYSIIVRVETIDDYSFHITQAAPRRLTRHQDRPRLAGTESLRLRIGRDSMRMNGRKRE